MSKPPIRKFFVKEFTDTARIMCRCSVRLKMAFLYTRSRCLGDLSNATLVKHIQVILSSNITSDKKWPINMRCWNSHPNIYFWTQMTNLNRLKCPHTMQLWRFVHHAIYVKRWILSKNRFHRWFFSNKVSAMITWSGWYSLYMYNFA